PDGGDVRHGPGAVVVCHHRHHRRTGRIGRPASGGGRADGDGRQRGHHHHQHARVDGPHPPGPRVPASVRGFHRPRLLQSPHDRRGTPARAGHRVPQPHRRLPDGSPPRERRGIRRGRGEPHLGGGGRPHRIVGKRSE